MRRILLKLYDLLIPPVEVPATMAKLEPGRYILIFDRRALSPANAAKIGFPQIDGGDKVKILKVGVVGDPRDVAILYRVIEDGTLAELDAGLTPR